MNITLKSLKQPLVCLFEITKGNGAMLSPGKAIMPMFLLVKILSESLQADFIMYREVQCKKQTILLFNQLFWCNFV